MEKGFLAPYRGQRYHLIDWREGHMPTTHEEFFNISCCIMLHVEKLFMGCWHVSLSPIIEMISLPSIWGKKPFSICIASINKIVKPKMNIPKHILKYISYIKKKSIVYKNHIFTMWNCQSISPTNCISKHSRIRGRSLPTWQYINKTACLENKLLRHLLQFHSSLFDI